MRLPHPRDLCSLRTGHAACTGGRIQKRSGKVLTLFALLLPVLLGMAGLVIDGGMVMTAQRHAQNAADSAALSAARDLLRGQSKDTATATAQALVQKHNGLADAQVQVNVGPASGPHQGNAQFVEVIVTSPVKTWLIQILGVSGQAVQGRAVAGYVAVSAGEGIAALDPAAVPGLAIAGGATLRVNGRVVANSHGSGVDEKGSTVDLGYPNYAASTDGSGKVQARQIRVVGGVDAPANFESLPGETGNPLRAGTLPRPDPLRNLPTPTMANGVPNKFWTQDQDGQLLEVSNPTSSQDLPGVNVSITDDQTFTFEPGVYSSITVTGGGPGTVTFKPGIYVVGVLNNSDTALTISTGATVTGNGVMFYNTGSNFDVASGSPDSNDGTALGTDSTASFGSVTFSGPNMTLTGILDASSPFSGMLLYQRRWNTKSINIQGNGSQTKLAGTLYARGAQLQLTGPGTFEAQFLAGSISVTGQAQITIDYEGKNLGKSNRVFLVE
ncbi:MAG: pilus assembly protein TadG-related protein [Gemmataceae bacterium]|nr:pilus assembly protein TadG-related protein [Gemmataceae bacterium]